MNRRFAPSPLFLFALGLLAVFAISAGCATVHDTFYGRDAGQVWTAMQAVAQSPEYRDWDVAENNVHIDESEGRVRVHRVLERTLVRPGARPWEERVTRQFDAVLERHDPPRVRVTPRSLQNPTRAREEGTRFTLHVRRLLRADEAALRPQRLPQQQPPAPVAEPEPERRPIEDLGDLLEP